MSAKLESTYNQSPDRTAQRLKKPRLAMSSLADSSSPNQEVTDRFCANRSNVTKNLQDIYLKETERYLINSYYNSPVVLTERQQSSAKRSSSWKFFDNLQNKKTQDQVSNLQKLLMNFGLLQVFRSFQLFRERVIEILSNEQAVESNKSKIEIYQIITTLKMQLEKIYRSSEEKNQYGQEVKQMLVKVSKLRRENDFLKDKNIQLSQKLRKYQNSQLSIDNSYLQNSIRFSEVSHLTEQTVSQLSFDLQVENLKINQFHTQSNSVYTSPENSILYSDQKHCSVISKQSRIEVIRNQQFQCQQAINIQLWKHTVGKCIEIVKKMIKNQFEATSLALLRNKCQNSYKSYKIKTHQQRQEIYLGEVNNFMQFIGHNSFQLSALVRKAVDEMKKEKVIKPNN